MRLHKHAALLLTLLTAGALLCRPAHADKDDDLWIESHYITQCSCSAANDTVGRIDPRLPVFGVLNDWRIGNGHADFVRPGEAAIGAVGLLVGYHQLVTDKRSSPDLDAKARAALSGFFQGWVLNSGNQIDRSDGAHPRIGFPVQIAYGESGRVSSKDPDANVGVSAEMLIALWKYVQLSPNGDRDTYRAKQFGLAHKVADYINGKVGGDGLVHDNFGNAYVLDNSYAVAAFHSFARWAQAEGDAGTAKYFDGQADKVSAALGGLQDPGPWHNYRRFKDAATGRAGYNGVMDQTGFAPYEFDARPLSEGYAKPLARWWDTGRSWHQTPTQQTGALLGGVHQQDYQNDATYRATPDGRYLYPGTALQLAAAEWKIAHATGNADNLDARARSHYDFARRNKFWNADRHLDSVIGGFNDWVNPADGSQQPETYKRFVDTSAYFIFASEMLEFSHDVDFAE
jgi:hypothetical protein